MQPSRMNRGDGLAEQLNIVLGPTIGFMLAVSCSKRLHDSPKQSRGGQMSLFGIIKSAMAAASFCPFRFDISPSPQSLTWKAKGKSTLT